MLNLLIKPSKNLNGSIKIPADKSITHRAIILAALQNKTILIKNWLQGLDCLRTLHAIEAMGIKAERVNANDIVIYGNGLNGLQAPSILLDLGNSGTALRLLTGVLCAQKFSSKLTGDSSLTKRPMGRVIQPLQLMGADIAAHQENFAPLIINPVTQLKSINYTLKIASAQVKSAILLADLYAERRSQINEIVATRNHTELMLDYLYNNSHHDKSINIPGDLSAAAFFIVAATITPGADLCMPNIGINPTRSACIEILKMMGADITISKIEIRNSEPSAEIRVKHAKLHGITIPVELVPNAIDEFPILAIAAACATGTTIFCGAKELRVKESDRLAAISAGLQTCGIVVQEFADGLQIDAGVLSGGTIDSFGDHRIAMAFAVAGLVAQQPIMVQNTQNIATSFPDFVAVAQSAGFDIMAI
jgi:3-phosphoshikimate 1-carboxyvinyltransferase